MTSYPSPGLLSTSVSSAISVRDAIQSYRRSQYLVADSAVAPSTDSDIDDEEALLFNDSEDDEDDLRTPHPRDHDEFISNFEWDTLDPNISQPQRTSKPTTPILAPARSESDVPREDTPLLRTVSFSSPRLDAGTGPILARPVSREMLRRISSSASISRGSQQSRGQSTFGQTLFNATAILLGIGLLSEPLAFAKAGWVCGSLLITFYGFISCYTAKILSKIIINDPRLRSYADIGRKAFGTWSTLLVSLIFCLELFGVSVVLVTLYADSLHTVLPAYSSDAYKLWGLLVILPTVFLPLSVLSYASILGIMSTFMIVAVVLVDGFLKTTAPGSIWSPAPTSWTFGGWTDLGLAFGLFMAGFSGHAVIPSLAKDMADPSQFDHVVNLAFAIATLTYALIGGAGYLMFGNVVSDEISVDLLKTPGYNALFNQIALYMLVVSPLTKFSLTTKPLNATIEILLGIDASQAEPDGKLSIACNKSSLKPALCSLLRCFTACMSVAVSILIPEFSSVMAFLGSFAAFFICVIGPIGAKVALEGRCSRFDGLVLIIALGMAFWGTVSLQFV